MLPEVAVLDSLNTFSSNSFYIFSFIFPNGLYSYFVKLTKFY